MDNDCGESDEDENGAPFSQFDVLNEDKESILTICVTDIDDIKTFLNIQ